MKKYLIVVLSLAVVLALNIYYRSYPIFLPQLKVQARNAVENGIVNAAKSEVNKKFPDYAPVIREGLAQALFSDYNRNNKKEIKKQVRDEYSRLKDAYQDKTGQTYLMELDGWHWGRYVNNVLRHGYPGDSIRGGLQFDEFMLAPTGTGLSWNNFFFYLSAFLYKAFSIFKPVPLATFLFYLPLFFTAVFIILLYLFCLQRWNNIVAVVACLVVGLSPIFITRSCAGWFDSDILNLTFPLLIIWFYLLAYERQPFKNGLPWIILSAFWVGLFCFSWINWWFIFIILIIYEIYSVINLTLVRWQYREDNLPLIKRHIITLCLFLFFSLGWVVIFSGLRPLMNLYGQIKGSLILNRALVYSIWPNVYSTVGELKRLAFSQVLHSLGGMFIFLSSMVSLLGLFLITARNPRYTVLQREAIIVLAFWFIAMLFACSNGIRFAMFLLIPLGIALGWGLSEVYLYFKRGRKWAVYILLAVILALSIKITRNAYYTAREVTPFMDDNWHKTLIAIKEKTPEDAIINSWWDFGDWFKVVAERRVIFDGQSQNSPRAYWMASVLISDKEEEAIAILRMLNNGGNRAFEIINKNFKDPFDAVMFLKKIISLNPKKAKIELYKALPHADAQEAIKIIFSRPAEAYFIVDYSMADKISPISFIGNWDFCKVYIIKNLGKKNKEEIVSVLKKNGVNSKLSERLYNEAELISETDTDDWLSKRITFKGDLVEGYLQGNLILFSNGVVYNPTQQEVHLYSGFDRKYKVPRSLFMLSRGRLKEITYPKNDLGFSILIFQDKGRYYSVALDRELARSLLVRLYFFGAKGLKHFQPFIENQEEGRMIRVFKINW